MGELCLIACRYRNLLLVRSFLISTRISVEYFSYMYIMYH